MYWKILCVFEPIWKYKFTFLTDNFMKSQHNVFLRILIWMLNF